MHALRNSGISHIEIRTAVVYDEIIGSTTLGYGLNGIGVTIDSLHIGIVNRTLNIESRIS